MKLCVQDTGGNIRCILYMKKNIPHLGKDVSTHNVAQTELNQGGQKEAFSFFTVVFSSLLYLWTLFCCVDIVLL